ncbi:hypothetical protein PAHAL_4G210200 [Panicum hallii]|uniref:Uncharacterized protein n=1 Tax=Panicum hallii TaxID=206008 RepID=A0A2T8JDI7_9POAL|nr:hypothetical protein PAHAL_4G210200 [Panicum hallii]
MEFTSSAIFHPRPLFPANFFVIHGISSSSSLSLRRSCSPREFTFRVFPFITKATQDTTTSATVSTRSP